MLWKHVFLALFFSGIVFFFFNLKQLFSLSRFLGKNCYNCLPRKRNVYENHNLLVLIENEEKKTIISEKEFTLHLCYCIVCTCNLLVVMDDVPYVCYNKRNGDEKLRNDCE